MIFMEHEGHGKRDMETMKKACFDEMCGSHNKAKQREEEEEDE